MIGAAGEERLEFSLKVVSHPFSIEVLEPGEFASLESADEDVLDCFTELRKQLEAHGILLCCMGARPDVWASGQLRQFTDGRRAYRHRNQGGPVTRDDEVDIFAPTDAADAVTVQAQGTAILSRFESLRRKRDETRRVRGRTLENDQGRPGGRP
ncbi:hypothetical protein ACIA8G_14900 [Lentzea sp. NPDC051213]|uniref:hypothetical protein n=1 Tax=Lentzea sp. NPDC051213 TaxID=3364126 RepID=UPI003789118C